MSTDIKTTNEDVSSPPEDAHELLAKLEAANRLLESDEKACRVICTAPSPTPTHSRKSSGSSVVSSTSCNSHYSNQPTDDDGLATGSTWEVWGKLVHDWESAKKKPKAIKEFVRKGIPHHFRGLAWQLLLGVNDSPHKDNYVEYLKQTSPSEKLIRRDIARTFPDHEFFKEKDGLGQESLFNVMKAYSLHDREVGYCQGCGFIVGLLLMQMPEEEAFAVLVKLMQDYHLRELFKPNMAELGLCMYKLECLIQDLLPDLYLHFQSQGFHTSMYASSWFLTLFATSFSLSLACRIMDLVISEGMEVIFRIGIAILQTSHEELMSMDMEGMLQFFQKQVPQRYEADPDRLFNTAFMVQYNAKKMKKVEKEYISLKSKENEDQIELRRLRTENRLLRQRVDNLEKESASLADRLIQYQVTRAQEAEETYALKNNFSTTKQKLADTQKKLENVEKLVGDIRERTSSISSAATLDDGEAQVVVQGLQEELIAMRLKAADTDSLVKELRVKIKDLEHTNIQLQKAPSNDVQHLQEELIAVKLREAEANLALKEMKHRVNELESQWEKYLIFQMDDPASPKDKNSIKTEMKQLQDEIMTVKLKEASCMSELKDSKQKIMELETQNHICTNQIRRMDEENKNLKTELESRDEKDRELKHQIQDLTRKIENIESERKAESMMVRIKDAENVQVVAELKHKIAELEIQKEELLTADRLEAKDGSQDLANRIYDLQDEVLQLKLTQKSPTNHTSFQHGSLSESDLDSDEDLENPETLNRTLSEIVEGKCLSPSSLNDSSLSDSVPNDSSSNKCSTPLSLGNNKSCNLSSVQTDSSSAKTLFQCDAVESSHQNGNLQSVYINGNSANLTSECQEVEPREVTCDNTCASKNLIDSEEKRESTIDKSPSEQVHTDIIDVDIIKESRL